MTAERRHRAALTALGVLVGFLSGCSRPPVDEVESETVVSVRTEAAALGRIRGVVHATGIVTPGPGADLVVVAPEAARIAEVPKATGDAVRRGELLVRFEIPTVSAEVQRLQAEVVRAQAALDTAQAAEARARQLFERGVAARREVEDASRSRADAEAALTQAQASLRAAQTVAGRSTVHATFDGIVAKRLHNPGDFVEPTASDPVLRVIDPHRLEVVASVPLADASRIELGAPARLVSPTAGAREIVLNVRSRPAAVDTGTATIPVRLGFAVPTDLPAGAPVEVSIRAEDHKDVVLIPAVAIVREGSETAVFVVNGDKAERRAVTIGLGDETSVEILSGLIAGELIIVDGQAGLPDGAAIAITNSAGTARKSAPGKAAEKDAPK